MTNCEKIEIKSEIQLLVEGKDQRNFFGAFKRHWKMDNIQIQDYGGGQELREYLKNFVKIRGFAAVQSLGVVRDAEKNAENTFKSVQGALRDSGLEAPDQPEIRSGNSPAVSVLILPGNGETGMLETLLCKTFEGTEEDACIKSFFECISKIETADVKDLNLDKARAWAYLTTKPNPHHSVGIATKQGCWGDLEREEFRIVRDFLTALRQVDATDR